MLPVQVEQLETAAEDTERRSAEVGSLLLFLVTSMMDGWGVLSLLAVNVGVGLKR